LNALNTGLNLGWTVLVMCLLGIVNSLWLGLPLFKPTPDWKEHLFDQITHKGHVEHLTQVTIEMGAWNQVLQRNNGNRRKDARFRMVGDGIAPITANPKLDVKVSLHPAFQCMVI
jgi:hypothetical protein